MNHGLAIASITAILKNILENGLVQDAALSSMGNVLFTTLPPDQITVGADGQPQLNLFLYQVTQNRNATSVNNHGDNYSGYPDSSLQPLDVNLHYLLTVYGTKDFQTELLLGFVMALMNQASTLSDQEVLGALEHCSLMNRTGLLAQAIATTSVATVAKQLGQIQIKPDLLNTEQMSRLWSLLRGAYRPSVIYQVSMSESPAETPASLERSLPSVPSAPVEPPVKLPAPPAEALISPESPMSATEPVFGVGGSADTQKSPRLTQVVASSLTNGRIIPGCDLILYGKSLQGEITKLRFDQLDTLLTPEIIEDSRLLLRLPSTLFAGYRQIQVIHQLVGMPTGPIAVSEPFSFKLHPTIEAKVEQTSTSEKEEEPGEGETLLRVMFSLQIEPGQDVILKLIPTASSSSVYTFQAPVREGPVDQLQIPIQRCHPGIYQVVASIDGVESFVDRHSDKTLVEIHQHAAVSA